MANCLRGGAWAGPRLRFVATAHRPAAAGVTSVGRERERGRSPSSELLCSGAESRSSIQATRSGPV
jgi:hypothetical protein